MDLTGELNWYDLYRENYKINKTDNDTITDLYGNPLEHPRIGKTVLKDGREFTYKRGHTFTEYVGKWNKHHPAVFAHNSGLR